MRKILLLSCLICSAIAFSGERFHIDDEKEKEDQKKRDRILEGIYQNTDHLLFDTNILINLLREINSVTQQYKVETNQQVPVHETFDSWND